MRSGQARENKASGRQTCLNQGSVCHVDAFELLFSDDRVKGVKDTRCFNVMLRGRGFSVAYNESAAGHNWTAWKDRLENAFVALMN